ncbi:MAG: hypothetical protein Ct9H90mP13_00300 [Pseudomonadota bacterium]|nr:MAG: hypothetical protein Ct9H90mP13_00300 [Pseudomonadota bacterium]
MLAGKIIMSFQNIFTTILKGHMSLIKPRIQNREAILQYNRNKLLRRDASVDGMKTGYTGQQVTAWLHSTKRWNSINCSCNWAKSDDDRKMLQVPC